MADGEWRMANGGGFTFDFRLPTFALKLLLSAVHVDQLPADHSGAGAAEKAHGAGDFFRLDEALHRNGGGGIGASRASGRPRRVHLARRDAVHPDLVLAKLLR